MPVRHYQLLCLKNFPRFRAYRLASSPGFSFPIWQQFSPKDSYFYARIIPSFILSIFSLPRWILSLCSRKEFLSFFSTSHRAVWRQGGNWIRQIRVTPMPMFKRTAYAEFAYFPNRYFLARRSGASVKSDARSCGSPAAARPRWEELILF